jgi:hypothetical protein
MVTNTNGETGTHTPNGPWRQVPCREDGVWKANDEAMTTSSWELPRYVGGEGKRPAQLQYFWVLRMALGMAAPAVYDKQGQPMRQVGWPEPVNDPLHQLIASTELSGRKAM